MEQHKTKRRREFYYPEKQAKRRRWGRGLFVVAGLVILYIILTTFVISNRVIETNTMQNDIKSGDRLLFSSRTLFHIIPAMAQFALPHRGDVVLLEFKDAGARTSLALNIAAPFVRFFTAQRVGLTDSRTYIKRIIGIPGDTVSMSSSVFRVKAADSPYTLTEFELSKRNYDPLIPNLPPVWDSSLPFSGNMKSITLGPGQYFVASDDRSDTNDSRTWGLVALNQIEGTALFRYWPLTRLGRP
jgi:signal peptidase I